MRSTKAALIALVLSYAAFLPAVGSTFTCTGDHANCQLCLTATGQEQACCQYYGCTWGAAQPTAASNCSAGTYSRTGKQPCNGTPCAAGRFGPTSSFSSSSATCTDCPPGRFAAGTGSSACVECPAGKWQSANGALSCAPCPVGRFSALSGAALSSTCAACSAGRFASSAGASACRACPAAKWQSAPGASSCILCGAGRHSVTLGAASAVTCEQTVANAATSADMLCMMSHWRMCHKLRSEAAREGISFQAVGRPGWIRLAQGPGGLTSDRDSRSAAAVDADNDGDIDLLVLNSYSPNELWINHHGKFALAHGALEGGSPGRNSRAAAVADVNNDGFPDVLVVNGGAPNELWLNDGNGTFTQDLRTNGPGNPSMAWESTGAAFADIDHDDDMDLVVVNDGAPNELWLNDGSGTFSKDTRTNGPGDIRVSLKSTGVAFADVNNDTHLDMFVTNTGAVSGAPNELYINQGDGTFAKDTRADGPGNPNLAQRSTGVSFADYDADGDVDMIVMNNAMANELWENAGGGRFQKITAGPGDPNDYSISVNAYWADLDGDADTDLVILNFGQSNQIWINQGSGTFIKDASTGGSGEYPTASMRQCYGAVLADFDLDGDTDMLFANGGVPAFNELWMNAGTTSFVKDTSASGIGDVTVPKPSSGVVLADLNNDSAPDVIILNNGASNELWYNDGSGIFSKDNHANGPGGNSATLKSTGAAVADVNNDGFPDVLVVNGGAPNELWLNDGNGTFTQDLRTNGPGDPSMAWESTGAAFADIDHDDDMDLVVVNDGAPNELWLNDGSGTFSKDTRTNGPGDIRKSLKSTGVAFADVNNDTHLDMFVTNTGAVSGAPNELYINQGDGTFAKDTRADGPGALLARTRSNAASFADFDGDGTPDLLVVNSLGRNEDGSTNNTRGRNELWQNQGTGVFRKIEKGPGAPASALLDSIGVAWADLDGDSDMDVIIVNAPGANTVWINHRERTTTGTTDYLELDPLTIWSDGIFSLDTTAGGPGDDTVGALQSTGVAIADLDLDGDTDVIVTNSFAANELFVKRCPASTFAAAPGGLCVPCPRAAHNPISAGTDRSCMECPAGQVSGGACASAGADSCSIKCLAFEARTLGQKECQMVAPGANRTSVEGRGVGVTSCPPGFLCRGGAEMPEPCAVGRYQDSHGGTVCKQCPDGKFQSERGRATCAFVFKPGQYIVDGIKLACPPGKFSTRAWIDAGNLDCSLCSPGQYQNATGKTGCVLCESGKFQLLAGQPFCDTCEPHSHYSATAGRCVCNTKYFRCPSSRADGQDCGDTDLNEAEQEKLRGACIACDTFARGADCNMSGSTLASIKSARGFWRATNATAVFHPCNPLSKGDCRGAMIPQNGTRDIQCSIGHTGPKCSVCDSAQGFVRKWHGQCARCAPGEGELLLVVAPIALLALGLLIWCVIRCNSSGTLVACMVKRTIKIRILFGFVQVLTRMTLSYDLHMPQAVAQFYQSLAFIEAIDFTSWLGSAGCVYESSYIAKVYLQTGIALFVLLVFFLWYAMAHIANVLDQDGDGKISCCEILQFVKHGCKLTTTKRPSRAMITCVNLALLFTFLIYPSITSTLFFALGCTEYEDGERYLTVDQAINCSDDSYLNMVNWCLIMIPIFVLGIPIVYLWMLRRHRAALCPKPRTPAQRRDAALVGRVQWAHQQREHDPSIQHLRFLWGGYRPRYWFFEVFEMVRKFLMTGVPILLNHASGGNGYIAVAYGMLVTVLTTATHAIGDPYLSHTDRLLVLPGQFEIFLSLVAGMVTELSSSAGANLAVTVMILVSGVPIALFMIFCCIRPDGADQVLLFARRKVVVELVAKLKLCVPSNLRSLTAIDWSKLEHDLLTKVSTEVLADAIDDAEAFLVRLLRAQLHARAAAGKKAAGMRSEVLARVEEQLANDEIQTIEHVLECLLEIVSIDTAKDLASAAVTRSVDVAAGSGPPERRKHQPSNQIIPAEIIHVPGSEVDKLSETRV